MTVNLLLIFFVLVVVAMIAFILVQKGTGATAGSAFGAGASSTVFGAKGSGNFLTKTTMLLAFLFFAISMFMAVNASKQFTTATTGEVDLGVVGTLDTSDSDVPEIKPVNPADSSEGSDMPSLEVKTDADVSTDTPVSDLPIIDASANDQVEDLIKKATDIKQDVETKAGRYQG